MLIVNGHEPGICAAGSGDWQWSRRHEFRHSRQKTFQTTGIMNAQLTDFIAVRMQFVPDDIQGHVFYFVAATQCDDVRTADLADDQLPAFGPHE